MSCPFPEMDPYLESPEFWPDFHARFVNCWCEALAERLPNQYEARIDERASLVDYPDDPDSEPARVKAIRPDVAVTRGDGPAFRSSGAAPTGLLEPVTIPLVFEPAEVRETYIEIRHRPDRKLVAVLELLSPTNKAGIGFGEYMKKRDPRLRQPVHLVELDLLVGGMRLPAARPMPPGDCFALVARSERRPWADVYAWRVRDPLPRIPIPLRPPDADVLIELREVFDTTYTRGRYLRALRYAEPPSASLAPADGDWATQLASTAAL